MLFRSAPDLDYGALGEVQDGGGAQVAYRELIRADTLPERKDILARGLRDYCALDTFGLVRVARHLEGRDRP